MNHSTPPASRRTLSTREDLAATDMVQMWRVATGAVRIDSAHSGEPSRFMRLALPGDVIGVEKWAGTDDTVNVRHWS
ncbi:MAG: hypothetical protein FD135_3344 [Comamonadaceae bacterium]|nr:MAG: hypothetical protein FD135_3344 [Comamonadaceae bacterium]